MEEKEPLCAIPRNLNKFDIVVHYPVKLNWKQISYIGAGVLGAYFVFQTALPVVHKTVVTVCSVGLSMIISLIKVEDSTIDDLLIDSLHFIQKKNIYNQIEKRGDINVRFTKYEEKFYRDSTFSSI